MRKLFCLFVLLLFTLASAAQDCEPNLKLEQSKKLGLIAYLSHVKTVSEIMAIEKGETAKDCYYSVKESSDVLINQLCADMTEKSGLKLYRDFNKEIKKGVMVSDRIKKYNDLVMNIDQAFTSLDTMGQNKTESTVIDALGTLGIEPYSIYKDIVAAKTKKVEGLVTQLRELRLQPLKKEKDIK
nr:hypothetical protein [Allomuricauda sp.]